jgi:hypothetical protein
VLILADQYIAARIALESQAYVSAFCTLLPSLVASAGLLSAETIFGTPEATRSEHAFLGGSEKLAYLSDLLLQYRVAEASAFIEQAVELQPSSEHGKHRIFALPLEVIRKVKLQHAPTSIEY